MTRVTVLGGGLWGTTLAQHLSRDGNPVTLWEFVTSLAQWLERRRTHPHIPGFRLRRGIRVTDSLEEAVQGAEFLVVVLPSKYLRSAARNLRPLLRKGRRPAAVVSAAKGLEDHSLRTMSEVLEEELRGLGVPVYAVSGPSFAREVARGVPTKLVLAGAGRLPPERLRRLFESGAMRLELSRDRKGVELAGALKNVMAIACGLADGLKLGANTKAVIITEAVAEMEAIVRGAGGDVGSVRGLAGLGDLIATGTSGLSRNRTLGEHMGGGKPLENALQAVRTVAEGVESAEGAYRLARSVGVRAPLVTAVREIVAGKRPPRRILKSLGF